MTQRVTASKQGIFFSWGKKMLGHGQEVCRRCAYCCSLMSWQNIEIILSCLINCPCVSHSSPGIYQDSSWVRNDRINTGRLMLRPALTLLVLDLCFCLIGDISAQWEKTPALCFQFTLWYIQSHIANIRICPCDQCPYESSTALPTNCKIIIPRNIKMWLGWKGYQNVMLDL